MDRHDAERVHHPDPVLLPQPVPKRRPEQGHQDQEAGRVGFGIGIGRVELFFFFLFLAGRPAAPEGFFGHEGETGNNVYS